MIMSEKIDLISAALVATQPKLESIKKDSKNPYFKSKYASLGAVLEAVTTHLNDNGISVVQPTMMTEFGKNVVETILLHNSGQYIGAQTLVLNAKENDPQGQGSGISYARRYGLMSLLALAADDDDAESAMNRGVVTSKSKKADF